MARSNTQTHPPREQGRTARVIRVTQLPDTRPKCRSGGRKKHVFLWSVVDKPSNSTDVCRGRGVELSLDSTYGTSTDDLAGHVSEITSDTRVRTSVPVQNTEPGGTDPPRKANLRPSFIHRRQTCQPSFNPKVKSPSFTSSPRPALASSKLQAP